MNLPAKLSRVSSLVRLLQPTSSPFVAKSARTSTIGSRTSTEPVPSARGPSGWRGQVPWIIVAIVATGLVWVVAQWTPWNQTSPPPALRLRIDLGAEASLTGAPLGTPGPNIAFAPDGATLAFVAEAGPESQPELYVRRFDRLEAAALEGTQNASGPFFSHDGRWIAFFADGRLKKIAAAGGAVATICDAANVRGGQFTDDGAIVLSFDTGVLTRMSPPSWSPESLTALAENELAQLWPQMLPGGRAVLFTSITRGADEADVVVQQVPRGARKVVRRGAHHGRYLRSGHLVYVRDGTLFAQPFDARRLEPAGPPAAAMAHFTEPQSAPDEAIPFDISDAGALVFAPPRDVTDEASIVSFDRDGMATSLSAPVNWSNPQVAPDGRRVAVDVLDGKQLDIWIYEMDQRPPSRLTLDPADDTKPVWTPDGRRVAFASRRADSVTFNLYWERTDGSGEIEPLATSRDSQYPDSWHPLGRFLAYQERATRTNFDIWILPFDGTDESTLKAGKPTVFLNSPFDEREAMFSPDGRWLAYQSNETGRYEVYVRPFAGRGGLWQISTGGGIDPIWSRARPELLFTAPDGKIMAVSYSAGDDSLRADKPRPWSSQRVSRRPRLRSIDVHPDGSHIVAAKMPDEGTNRGEVVLVFNLFDELRRIAPVSK
jgi:Tol biopolymer transport system component